MTPAPRHPSPIFMALAAVCLATPASAQTAPPPEQARLAALEQRLNDLGTNLTQTQTALQRSLFEIQRLRAELNDLRAQAAKPDQPTEALQDLREQQQIQQAEIKVHEQTKVESASKYPIKVTGLALFNTFSNAGVVDNAEIPAVALQRTAGASHGSLGGTFRQTILGIQATGPTLWGAHSSAYLNADFFGGTSTNTFGYTTLAGNVRLRDAQLTLDWANTSVQAGNNEPIISPLSPTSFAQVAMPALSGSGNLWAWAPQITVQQRFSLGATHGLFLEGGLIVPQSPSYTSTQLDSPVQASRRPGIEGRVSYHADRTLNPEPNSLTFGVSGYSANQAYNATTHVHSWAVTGDYQIPLTHFITVSGELYRGRSLGGFGGGLYKDIFTGTDPVTGLARTIGIDTAGGWTQLKLSLSRTLEANAVFGIDDVFASNFDEINLPSTATTLGATARNSSVVGNLIFRPRHSIILSPEYRRILTWRYTGPANVANIYTLSFGYQF